MNKCRGRGVVLVNYHVNPASSSSYDAEAASEGGSQISLQLKHSWLLRLTCTKRSPKRTGISSPLSAASAATLGKQPTSTIQLRKVAWLSSTLIVVRMYYFDFCLLWQAGQTTHWLIGNLAPTHQQASLPTAYFYQDILSNVKFSEHSQSQELVRCCEDRRIMA